MLEEGELCSQQDVGDNSSIDDDSENGRDRESQWNKRCVPLRDDEHTNGTQQERNSLESVQAQDTNRIQSCPGNWVEFAQTELEPVDCESNIDQHCAERHKPKLTLVLV